MHFEYFFVLVSIYFKYTTQYTATILYMSYRSNAHKLISILEQSNKYSQV